MPIQAPGVNTPTPGVFTSTLRVVDPATGSQLLTTGPFTPIVLNMFDDGYPNIRSVSVPISGSHGMTDTTQWFGDRAITAQFTLPQGPAADPALDLLRSCAGLSGYYLYLQRPGWTQERRVYVHGASFTCPPGVNRQAQVGWTAPAGLLEDSLLSQVPFIVSSSTAQGGFTFPVTFPVSMTPGLVTGAGIVQVGGTIPAAPTIDIYGPCSDPIFRCISTGAQISFAGLSISAGDYLHVDMGSRTATLNNDPAQSRYNRLDIATSSWWTLPLGPAVELLFAANNVGSGCYALMSWRSRWL